MKIVVIFGAQGTFRKNFEKRLGQREIIGRIDAMKTIEILISARILRRVLGKWEVLT